MAPHIKIKATSDFKPGARRVILPEFVTPLVVILLSALFVAVWGHLFYIKTEQLLEFFYSGRIHLVLPGVISLYALLDFSVAFLLLLSIYLLHYGTGIFWILLQVLFIVLLYVPYLISHFLSLNILQEVQDAWAWIIASSIVISLYKLYRIRIIYFLLSELREENRIWNQEEREPSICNYE